MITSFKHPLAASARSAAWLQILFLVGLLGAPALQAQAPAAKLLEDGRKLCRQGKIDEALRLLRSLLKDYPESEYATAGRDALAKLGAGLNYRVRLEDRRALNNFQVNEEKVARQVEGLLDDLLVFYRQTYGKIRPVDFEIVVYDNRARFRDNYTRTHRRSAYTPLPADAGSELRGRIAVYFDSRNASPKDINDLLYGSLSREASVGLLQACVRQPLPEGFKAGLAEYLAARLFPAKLVGLAQSQEEILQGFAREALRRFQRLKDFKDLLDCSEENNRSPLEVWHWRGSAYALVDCLLHAEFKDLKLKGKAEKEWAEKAARIPPVPRHVPLQRMLRDLESLRNPGPGGGTGAGGAAAIAAFEEQLERHFSINLEIFHQGFVMLVQKYSPKHPDYEHFSE